MSWPVNKAGVQYPEVYPYWMVERPYMNEYAKQLYNGNIEGPLLPTYATPKSVYNNFCHFHTDSDMIGPAYSMWKPMYPVYNNYPLKPNTGVGCAPMCPKCRINFDKTLSYSQTPNGRIVSYPAQLPIPNSLAGRNCNVNSTMGQLTSGSKKYLSDYYRPPIDVSELRKGNMGSYPTLL